MICYYGQAFKRQESIIKNSIIHKEVMQKFIISVRTYNLQPNPKILTPKPEPQNSVWKSCWYTVK